jgi:bifunctional UDP-N-acetylglucosamine pyrophosphorylase/glucosamine-1-phosphate N-acetyltransferase
MGRTAAIILAAGKGTRMRSTRPKVLHAFLGRPMLFGPLDAAVRAGADEVVVVVGHQADAVRKAVEKSFPGWPIKFAVQTEQRGTGHAVQCALPVVENADELMVLYGDTPLVSATTLRNMLKLHRSGANALTLSSFVARDPTGYGRIVRGDDGRVTSIVEHADASPAERAILEVNAGICVASAPALRKALGDLAPHNAQGEIYLTDATAFLARLGQKVDALVLPDADEVRGVNDRAQLAELEEIVLRDIRRSWMERGVSLHAPHTIRIDATVDIGEDTTIGQGVQLLGRTRIGRACRIEAGSVLVDCELGDAVRILPYTVAERATIASQATVGPFAHLRPGTELGEKTKIGNFVETKKARFGSGSKASHLSYIGDAIIGRDVNIGAGTITCNYDGVDKHETVLEDGVFIGSDTQLVAPVRVGANAVIGAGTTVTRNVAPGALAVTRAPAKEIADYYTRYVLPKKQRKAAEEAVETESVPVGPVASPLSRRMERPVPTAADSDDPTPAPATTPES